VGCVADILDEYAASIFRVEECMTRMWFIYRQVWSSKTQREGAASSETYKHLFALKIKAAYPYETLIIQPASTSC